MTNTTRTLAAPLIVLRGDGPCDAVHRELSAGTEVVVGATWTTADRGPAFRRTTWTEVVVDGRTYRAVAHLLDDAINACAACHYSSGHTCWCPNR